VPQKGRVDLSLFSDRFRSEGRRFRALNWTGPYLLVPILLIAALVVESRLQESGLMAYIPVGKRSGYSIWRALMLCCMVGTPLTTMFMNGSWKILEGRVKFSAWFFGTFAACFTALFLVMNASAFILLPPLAVHVGFIASRVFPLAALTAFWAVAAATLWFFMAPLGEMIVAPSVQATLAVCGHSVFYLMFSYIVLRKTTG
jgi:hypothetical protein